MKKNEQLSINESIIRLKRRKNARKLKIRIYMRHDVMQKSVESYGTKKKMQCKECIE